MGAPGRTWGGLTAEERGGRRREQLLEAGLEVFGVRGWAGTTVLDLCTAAGLSQRYFYEQFAGREACFLAVLDRVADEVEASVRDAVRGPGTPQDRAQSTLAGLVTLFTADPRKLRVAFVETFATADFRARRAELLRTFATLAARLMAAFDGEGTGRADPSSLALSAYILSGGIAEAFVAAAEGHLELDPDVLIPHLTALYRNAATLTYSGSA